MRVVLTLIWWLNRLKSILMAFKSLWRPLKARKKDLKNNNMTSFSNSFYDSEFLRIDASKDYFLWKNMYQRKSKNWENSSSMLWSIYFMLTTTNRSHCNRLFPYTLNFFLEKCLPVRLSGSLFPYTLNFFLLKNVTLHA